MAEHDDARTDDADDRAARHDDRGGALLGGDDTGDRDVHPLVHGIDQVAAKVKGLLRSDR